MLNASSLSKLSAKTLASILRDTTFAADRAGIRAVRAELKVRERDAERMAAAALNARIEAEIEALALAPDDVLELTDPACACGVCASGRLHS